MGFSPHLFFFWGGGGGCGFESTSLFFVHILVYEGRGFESTSWFWGDMGLSLQLCFWGLWVSVHIFFLEGEGGGRGFESTSLFFGGGGSFFF